MMNALNVAATGMKAREQELVSHSNNLSNLGTTAYKKEVVEFQDLMYQTLREPNGEAGVNQVPVGVQVGSGVKVGAQYSVDEQGTAKRTNRMFDLMIMGDGYFPVQHNGEIAYTRDGTFKLMDNRLVTTSGDPLIPEIQIPAGTAKVDISPNGQVIAINNEGQEQVVGQIQLVSFINAGALMKKGSNLSYATAAAGPPTQGSPGQNGLGSVEQGALEQSNVNPTQEMVELITTQRAFESAAKVMTIGDQMWGTVNNIGK